jgi:hypothetical protein
MYENDLWDAAGYYCCSTLQKGLSFISHFRSFHNNLYAMRVKIERRVGGTGKGKKNSIQ